MFFPQCPFRWVNMFFVAFLGSSRHGVGRETSHETDTCEPKVLLGLVSLPQRMLVWLISTFVQWNTHEHFPIVAPIRVFLFLVSLRTVYVRKEYMCPCPRTVRACPRENDVIFWLVPCPRETHVRSCPRRKDLSYVILPKARTVRTRHVRGKMLCPQLVRGVCASRSFFIIFSFTASCGSVACWVSSLYNPLLLSKVSGSVAMQSERADVTCLCDFCGLKYVNS